MTSHIYGRNTIAISVRS